MLRKLLIIVMGIFLVIAAGSCNIYPLYLSQMIDKFGFTLNEANLYGSSINLGLWMAFTMGFIYDKYGPKISCIIGAICISGSYFTLFLLMNSNITSLSIWPMVVLGFIMGQGSALCYTTAITTNLKNFRIKESAAIVGLLVANMAISPSIFTTYRQALVSIKIHDYFLFISIFLAVIILINGFIVVNIEQAYSVDKKEYEKYKEKKVIYLLVLLNILTLMVYTFGVIYNNISSDSRFPNAIVYPCLQMLNFTLVILEVWSVFDKLYFKDFINKKIRKEVELKENQRMQIEAEQKGRSAGAPADNPQALPVLVLEKKQMTEDKFSSFAVNYQPRSQALKLEYSEKVKKQMNRSHELDNKPKSLFEQVEERGENYSSNNESSSAGGNKVDQIENLNIINEESEVKENRYNENFENSNISVRKKTDNLMAAPSKDLSMLDSNGRDSLATKSLADEIKEFFTLIGNKEILILFSILTLGIGSAIANLNNVAVILRAIIHSPSNTEIFEYAILFFVFNSFFRIFSGMIMDKLVKYNKFFHYLVVMSCIGFISQVLGAFMERDLLFISMALTGAFDGGYMTFTPIYARTQFGLKNMGKILGFLTTGCALGSILISDFVFIIFYDVYKVDNVCLEKRCFNRAYIITSVFLAINIGLSVVLLKIKTRDGKSEINT